MRTRLLMLAALALAALLVSVDTASAALVCGCKRNTNGRVRRITAGAPLTCRPSQTLVCWNEDPPPGDISARVFNSTNLSIPNDAETTLTFDSERWDTDGIHSTSANPDRLTAPVAGKYYVFGHVSFAGNAAGPERSLRIYVNGTNDSVAQVDYPPVANAARATSLSISTHIELQPADFVILRVIQDSGGPLDINVSVRESPEFGMVKLP